MKRIFFLLSVLGMCLALQSCNFDESFWNSNYSGNGYGYTGDDGGYYEPTYSPPSRPNPRGIVTQQAAYDSGRSYGIKDAQAGRSNNSVRYTVQCDGLFGTEGRASFVRGYSDGYASARHIHRPHPAPPYHPHPRRR